MTTEAEATGMCYKPQDTEDHRNHLWVGGGQGVVPPRASGRTSPQSTMISDYWTPELGERDFCCSKPPCFVTTCYGSPRKVRLLSFSKEVHEVFVLDLQPPEV